MSPEQPEQLQNDQPVTLNTSLGDDPTNHPTPVPPAPASVITPDAAQATESSQPVTPTDPQVQAPAQQPQLPHDGTRPTPVQSVTPETTPAATVPAQPLVMKRKRRWPIILLIVLIIVVLAVGATYALLKKPAKSTPTAAKPATSQITNMTVKVPASWKKIDTDLGFSISAPSDWSAGTDASADINGLQSKTVTISPASTGSGTSTGTSTSTPGSSTTSTNASSTNGTSSSSDTAATSPTQNQTDQSQLVTVGTQKLDTDNTEIAFTQRVTHLSSADATTLKGLGIDTSKVTVTSKSIKINGKQWLEVTTNIPNQFSENLYYWDADHAIALVVTGSTQANVQQLSQSYLFPMAASMKLTSVATSQ